MPPETPDKRKCPRKLLTLEEKLAVIRTQEDEKLTVRELANRFNIGKTQAHEILRNKDAINNGLLSGHLNMSQVRRNPLSQHGAHIDELVFDWFSLTRKDNVPISGQFVREKAREIAVQMGYDGFSASPGWLQKWRKRHNINYNETGDSLDVQEFETILVKSEPLSNREDDDLSSVDLVKPIYSIEEAMMQLARLKEFVKDDFISYQQLVSLENQWSWKWNNFKKGVP
ncbi:tigger transposable element-derived protein 3 isoform X1 [Drosophila kikkawai]|uniref:Tigger transposable element-derived protein 3 isoform X1 n=2 Tax=Drosophila kikkawai TaxID=30033 RepID=A0A6P4IEY3_DROKI|nr:tigger transposable element-derived protein 3 isoform X1 [Drosophila kikkawai]KAH8336813.1 hypothetical protein KR059_004248 [Drosophila kikkawai]